MDLEVLRAFLVTAREENVTRAARLLHVSQPTLSRQMRQLEEELGTALFLRGQHSLSLTEAGMLFRRRAQEMLTLAERARSELRTSDASLTGEIAVGCNESRSMRELAEWIVAFRRAHPLVKFTLRSGGNEDIQTWLDQGTVDFGILVEPAAVERYSYVRMRSRDAWGVLVHESSPLAELSAVHAEDLMEVPLITVMDETIHRALTRWSGPYADRMMPIVHYNLLANAATLVEAQAGAAVCPRPDGERAGLRFVPFDPPFLLGAQIAWKTRQVFAPASAAFAEYLEQRGG